MARAWYKENDRRGGSGMQAAAAGDPGASPGRGPFKQIDTMTHASLFSGIGGPEVAAAMLGWANLFHCEINPFGRAVLEYWFPDSESYEDIFKCDFRKWRGRVDVLTGGFPCPPFSYAGKRRGANDDRYLWPQMLRAIDEIRPSWVVGENVAGLATMVEGGVLSHLGCDAPIFPEGDDIHGYSLDQTFTIERICKDLECIGYSVQPVLIPAAAVGAPHRRDRIFILANDADANRRNDKGGPRKDAGAGERIQERDEVREPGKPNQLRSEIQGTTENAVCDGPGIGRDGIKGNQRNVRDTRTRNNERICGEERANATDAKRRGGGTLPAPIHTGVADGDEPFRDGSSRPSSYADRTGREKPKQPGRRADSEETGARLHNRAERFGGDGYTTNTVCEGLEGSNETGERVRLRGNIAGHECAGLQPGKRWADFPTVSPVQRGNDGLPFPLDDLTIPATKWRNESLKAYGNAIVPQVMYRIFQAIEDANGK